MFWKAAKLCVEASADHLPERLFLDILLHQACIIDHRMNALFLQQHSKTYKIFSCGSLKC